MTELLAFFQTPAGIAMVAAVAHALPYIGVKLPIVHQLFTGLAGILGATPTAPAAASPAPAAPAGTPASSSTIATKLAFVLNLVKGLMAHPDPATKAAAPALLAVAQAQMIADHPETAKS